MNPVTDPVPPVVPESTPASPAPAAVGQSDNWEARFKGLQTTQNQTAAQLKAAQDALAARNTEFTTYKQTQEGALQQAMTTAADWEGKWKTASTEVETHKTKAQKLEEQLNLEATRKTQRQLLIDAGEEDLVGFFESNHLNLSGVTDVESVKKATESFRAAALKIAEKAYQGAAPRQPNPDSKSPTPSGMNADALQKWLEIPSNFDSPQYTAFHDAYLDLVSGKK